MSVRRGKNGLVINWSKTLTILSPWKRDKADAVVDSEVVLTKVNVLSRCQGNLLTPAHSSVSSANLNHSKSNCDAAAQSLCPDSRLWELTVDHVDSEDSGLDSSSSPPRSHTSPMHSSSVHRRGSSSIVQGPEKHPFMCTGLNKTEEGPLILERAEFPDCSENSHRHKNGVWTNDSSEEFAEERCRLQTQCLSGLEYLEQVCRLMERISQLQDLVLHLQKELRIQRLNKSLDLSLERHKLPFLMQRCTCGATDLVQSEVKTQNQTKSQSQINMEQDLSPDLRTVSESVPQVLRCRERTPCRSWSRHSFTEDHCTWSNDMHLHRELSHRSNLSWGRVQDFVRTRSKSRFRAGSLKMSCPQLHRADRGQIQGSMILLNQSLD